MIWIPAVIFLLILVGITPTLVRKERLDILLTVSFIVLLILLLGYIGFEKYFK